MFGIVIHAKFSRNSSVLFPFWSEVECDKIIVWGTDFVIFYVKM